MIGILDCYDIIINRVKNEVKAEKEKYAQNTLTPVFKFKNDVRILTVAGEVAEVYLKIHNLSHYKNKKTNIQIGAPLDSYAEKLIFKEIYGNCFHISKEVEL